MSEYEIIEKDIDSTVNYLRIFHPENANREYAIEILKYFKASARRMAFTSPDALNELYVSFERSKKGNQA